MRIIQKDRQPKFFNLLLALLLTFSVIPAHAQEKRNKANAARVYSTTLTNFNSAGEQIVRFDNMGDAIDAHDGEIAEFNGVYYLYGTSYDCGFEWGKKDAPFCGFKVYSSSDMVHWTDKGFLFDASTQLWQTRCNGNTYGCFRPHVIYNKKTKLYVLWINVYDNRIGFRVFTSATPTGPFQEVAEPTLAVNKDSPVAGLNNGDHDTFVDDDGKAYIAYTDWRTTGTIVIEELSADYLTGNGNHVKAVTAGNTEAPALFKRKGVYYITYSDPNCGYCSGTGTSYKTAKSPLGPWSKGIKISQNSCGGQPSFVSVIKLSSGDMYLYGSDLWNNAAKNEALANYYWAPLEFREDGSIKPMACHDTVKVVLAAGSPGRRLNLANMDLESGIYGFMRFNDIGDQVQRGQSFIANRTGILTEASVTTFKTGYPNAGLTVELYESGIKGEPMGSALSSVTVPATEIGWSPRQLKVFPKVPLTKGKSYCIILKSTATQGKYGFTYSDELPYKNGIATMSRDAGKQFRAEEGRSLKFYIRVD